MKAMMCKAYGPPESLTLEELDPPPLGAGEVRLAIHACGINFPDSLIIQNKYQVKPPLPFAPGSESAGEVIEVGDGVDGLKVGDRVIRFEAWGGYADEAVAPAANCLPMPPSMDYVTAAGFVMAYGSSYHALKQRSRLAAGETLLVLGAAGGLGLTAVELGKVMGATVIAAASSDEKLQVTKEAGADHTINYSNPDGFKDRVKELTGGRGADVVYDPVGGDLFDLSLRSMNKNGRYLVIGFTSGRIPSAPANIVLLKEIDVVGVFWGAFMAREPEVNRANFVELFELYEKGGLKPHVSATYPLGRAADALNALLTRKATGKVVLTTDHHES